jgi:hypothetical protein
MQYRTVSNSALSIVGLFSLIGWLGPRILKFINLVQDADGLREMMNLVAIKDVSISWQGIYLFGFIASGIGIIAINFDLAQKYYRRRIVSSYRAWDMNGCDAILYIVNDSLLGKTFPEESARIRFSKDSFYEAAEKGKIQVAGIAEGSTLLENIPRHIWNGENKLDIGECMTGTRGRTLYLRWKDEEKILYRGLMVDGREIQKTWPEAPIRPERV